MFNYKFSAIKGVQGTKEYYIAMVPLKYLGKLFTTSDEYVSPEFRAQRILNEKRLPDIKNYILDNLNNYVFTSLAASIDGEFEFTEFQDNLGTLEISFDAKLLLNDGQHRKESILLALNENEMLGNETISIVFYSDSKLQRSQQIFTDLNKHAVKVPNSIAECYDTRNPISVVSRKVLNELGFMKKFTDKDKDNLGKNSFNLFTLTTFVKTNAVILSNSKEVTSDDEKYLLDFWSEVEKNMVQWNELVENKLSKKDLREQFICTQAIVIKALGKLGKYYLDNKILLDLSALSKVEWMRSNEEWMFRNIDISGKIVTNEKAINSTANYLKKCLGLELSIEEKKLENEIEVERMKQNGK